MMLSAGIAAGISSLESEGDSALVLLREKSKLRWRK